MSAGDDGERQRDVRRWLRYAREDALAAAAALDDTRMVPRHACFLAQQSAEKALEAVLVFLGIDPPRQHDLDALRLLIPQEWSVARNPLALEKLTVWAVEARYPGDLPDADGNDAKEAVEIARSVYALVSSDRKSRGVSEDDPADGPG
jgi:HEPN domain-containing protein